MNRPTSCIVSHISAYPDTNPPVPGNPCRYDKSKVVVGTDNGFFNATTGNAANETQMAAFIHHNGPVSAGINANVFGLREKGCEAKGDCFITVDMCNNPKIKGKSIDHSITTVGYGTDPVHGDYWIIKNSWSTKFANGKIHTWSRGTGGQGDRGGRGGGQGRGSSGWGGPPP